MNKSICRVWFQFTLVSLCCASTLVIAQEATVDDLDAKVQRMSDMLAAIPKASVEFGAQAIDRPDAMAALAPGQSVEALSCLRTELSTEGFRKRNLAQVRAYAEADRSRFAADYSLLDDGFATTLVEFSNKRWDDARTGRRSAVEYIQQLADHQRQLLFTYFDDSRFRPLRELVEQTDLERPKDGDEYSSSRQSDNRSRSMALAVAPAFQACRLPLPVWMGELISLTAALDDPSALTPDFRRICNARIAVLGGDLSNDKMTLPRVDPARPISSPPYAQVMRRAGIEGTVMVRVLINERGETVSAGISKSSGHVMLDSAAVESARDWRFVPAREDGKLVCMSVTIPLIFKLSD